MADPLNLLRQALKNGESIELLNSSFDRVEDWTECSFIHISRKAIFARGASTNYKSKKGTGEAYALDAVLHYSQTQHSLTHKDYLLECKRLNLSGIAFIDRKDLSAYLLGERSDCIDASLPVPKAIDSLESQAKTAKLEEMSQDDWIKEITAHERPFSLKDAHLLGLKAFGDVIKIVKSTRQKAAAPESEAQPTSLLEDISSANKAKAPDARVPIIIVPAAPSALLTLFNAKEFLFNERFEPSAKMKESGCKKEPVVKAIRSSSKALYHLIDTPQKLKPSDWQRVVAVFAQGTNWQFKGWRWPEPVELFSHVLGLHLKFEDVKTDPNISSWNVRVVQISRNKRHLDKTAAMEVWDLIDRHAALKKLDLDI